MNQANGANIYIGHETIRSEMEDAFKALLQGLAKKQWEASLFLPRVDRVNDSIDPVKPLSRSRRVYFYFRSTLSGGHCSFLSPDKYRNSREIREEKGLGL